MLMKGQTNIISVMLITGILIAAISSAYFWGLPLLEKSRDSAKVERIVEKLKEIADIVEIVARDKVSRNVDINFDGYLKITNKTIELTTFSNAAYVSMKNWVVLNEDDYQGIPDVLPEGYGLIGRDRPGVLIAKAGMANNKIRNDFKIVFREIEDLNTKKGTQIVLNIKGRYSAPSGKYKLIFEYLNDKILPSKSKSGGDLRIINVGVRIA